MMITYLASDGEHLKAWSSASAISLPPLSSPQKAASVAAPGPGRKILGDPVVMIIVKVIAMFILMMIKMLTAKQTTIVTVTAFDTAMMIQTVME